MSASKSAAFVIPHPYVDALACFREPIAYLADAGWTIDLFTGLSPIHPAPFFGRERVRLIPVEMSRSGAIALVRRIVLRRPRYGWIVTVPQWGLHYAGIAARLVGIPMGCISDELRPAEEAATAEQRRWNARERRAHQRCRWTIALSDDRAEFIRRENALGGDHRVFVVPNAPAGPAARRESRYFHDLLSLGAGQRVLLHAGSLWWRGAEELIDAARSWNSHWVAVFQDRFASAKNGAADSAHVRFVRQVLPAWLLDHAVSSATIGLALYDDSRANNRLMGTASGKVSLYMKNGLPVIATRAGGLDWIEREGCGVCIGSVAEIPGAAERICARYDEFAAAVQRYYDERLEFGTRFRPVARLMEGW